MEKILTPKELHDIMAVLISGYGLPSVALALMQVTDDYAHIAAQAWQDAHLGKKWAACANAAVDFEKVAIREFGV